MTGPKNSYRRIDLTPRASTRAVLGRQSERSDHVL